jgi:hypothetical protein
MRLLPIAQRRLGLLALLAALAGPACTSRTVPLPPPTIDSVSAVTSQGLTVVSGLCEEGASVGVLNERSERGVLLSSDETGCGNTCPFEAQLPAEPGDSLRIWQFRGTMNPAYETVPDR